MAAVAHLPFYSTSYGENFGYNERDGSNTSTFRNRYLNEGYRGTAELGPVRFAATQAQATHNLAHVNATRPQTAVLARTQMATQPMQQAPAQQMDRSFALGRPISAAANYTQGVSAPPSWGADANRSVRQLPQVPQAQQSYQQAQQQSLAEERFEPSNSFYAEEAPRGVYTAPAGGQQKQRSFGQQSMAAPGRTLQEQRAAQHAEFSRSIAARFALPEPNANPSVNASPYYVPPYEQPPSSSFAPAARALGNRTYAFEVEDDVNYPYAPAFRGSGLISNKPAQDPGQSIPFGRLQAEDAREVRHRMAMDSWSTFNVATREGGAAFNLDGVKRKPSVDSENYCKWSISQRLPLGDQLRYHVPGYTGFVPTSQLRHGHTYGRTTRQCIAGSQTGL